ncbi:TetR/AcrR family transcriptional regulator [Mucilaginibacter limnophilus]|uniref:TetR/AcrR family transcriptional regulator n=1 Tax=Mucilaginibacter limnophilus TaxID=1932778 RepID=A0A437MTR1_9SPHI|nr:TetR/AcrR family transcriptional regulator [Mucilaginibacter limnophilus]RVU01042.1 TetR/AcrR family transcriptional regulator [Mucilaginibacter limnophilus]
MGILERRQRQKDEVRNDIIYAAWDMVQKEGWDKLSIRKIADAIEYSVPVIYDHFENKEAILLEFAKKGFKKLSVKIIEAKDAHKDPADQIRAMADAYWDFAFNNTQLYQLMFGIGMASCEIGKAMPEQDKFRLIVMEPIEALIKNSGREDVNSCLKYHTFWSVMHGLISIKLMGNPAIDAELNKIVLDDAIAGFIKNLS